MAKTRPFFDTDRERSKEILFRLIGYEIHDTPALDFHRDENPHQIVVAPTRTSKSYSAAPEATHDFFPDLVCNDDGSPVLDKHGQPVAVTNETIVWLVGTDYQTLKEWTYCWVHIHDMGVTSPFGRVRRAINNASQGNMIVEVEWGTTRGKNWIPLCDAEGVPARSIMQGKSAANQKSLQSEEVKTCILSEAADHDRDTVERHLGNRCGRIIYPTTPKRKAVWLYEMIEKGESDPSLGISHFKFTRKCNPKYDYARYEREKAKSTASYGDYHLDAAFMEQFEAEWTFEGGKVLPFRWVEQEGRAKTNVVHDLEPWVATASWYVTTDYGYNDPSVALWVAVGHNQKMLIAAELYETGLEPGRFAEKIKKRTEDLGVDVEWYVPDPQQPFITELLQRHGLPLYDRNPPGYLRDRGAGYEALRDALCVQPETNEPNLYVHSSCVHTIAEWKQIRFKDNTANEFSTGSIIGHDHCFHPDTEMLTDGGWKRVGDVELGELVASRSHMGGEMSWEPVADTIKTHFDGNLIGWKSKKGGNFLVTPNHKLCVASQYSAKRGDGKTFLIEAQEFMNCETKRRGHGEVMADQFWIPAFSEPSVPGVGLHSIGFDGEIAYLLGFYLAEGCRSITRGRKYVHLDQKDPEILERLQSRWGGSLYATAHGMHRLSIRSDELYDVLGEKALSWQKRVPRWFFDHADLAEHEALFDGLMDGDGTWSQYKYDTTSPGLADDFMELSSRLGRVPNLTVQERSGTKGQRSIYRVRYRRPETTGRYFTIHKSQLEEVPYTGEVVCVTVPPHHTILTRLNGRAMWIGQSADAMRYLLRSEPRHKAEDRDWVAEFQRGLKQEERMRRLGTSRGRRPTRLVGHSPMMAEVR